MSQKSKVKNKKFVVIPANHSVIPAKAGIQGSADKHWIPVFTGMTVILTFAFCILHFNSAFAVNNVPPVNLNDSGFHLLQCDGPDLRGLPPNSKITINGKSYDLTPGLNPTITNADGSNSHVYQPCNFQGLMIEIQYLLNVMTIAGVLAAIIGFAIAGGLYVTGVKKNIDRAHSMFPKIAIGFILILSAWFIVYQILSWLTGSSGAAALLGNGS